MTRPIKQPEIDRERFKDLNFLKPLVERCIKQERSAQGELYTLFSSVLYPICLRYSKDDHHAMDLLHDSFMTIYTKLETFEFKGSFEGWLKRITVNTALQDIRKNKKMIFQEGLERIEGEVENEESIESEERIGFKKILEFIQELPEGCRTIFNLYQLDGYKHQEIAEILKVSVGTSKSQYFKAKKLLKERIKDHEQGCI